MEKTLSMGAFTELDEREMMETEGGVLFGILGVCISEGINASKAKAAAERQYNLCRNDLINQINENPKIISSVPQASIEYFNIHGTNGGHKGISGGIY